MSEFSDEERALLRAVFSAETPEDMTVAELRKRMQVSEPIITAHLPEAHVRALVVLHRKLDEAADVLVEYVGRAPVGDVADVIWTMRQGAEIIRATLFHVPPLAEDRS